MSNKTKHSDSSWKNIRYKWKLAWSIDLTQWGVGYCFKAVWVIVNQSRIRMVVPKMSIKSSKRDSWAECCTINLGEGSVPYRSLLTTLGLWSFSHLSTWVFLLSPLPLISLPSQPSMLTIFRTKWHELNRCPTQSPINFPTWSSCDDMFLGLGSSPGNDQLVLWTWFLCHPSGSWSSSTGVSGLYANNSCSLSILICSSPKWYVAWS